MGGSKREVMQYPKTCFRPGIARSCGHMQSLKKHENEEGRPETEFANVGLNRVGPGDPERV